MPHYWRQREHERRESQEAVIKLTLDTKICQIIMEVEILTVPMGPSGPWLPASAV